METTIMGYIGVFLGIQQMDQVDGGKLSPGGLRKPVGKGLSPKEV